MSAAFLVADRAATLLTLILIFGAVVFRVRVVEPLYRSSAAVDQEFANRMFVRCVQTGAISSMVLIALAFARFHLQVIALFDTWHGVGAEQLKTLLLETVWGYAWLLQVLSAIVIALSPFLSKRPLDGLMAIPLATSAALSGHAASVQHIAPLTVGMDALHVLAAGGWVGGIYFIFASFALGNAPDILRLVRNFNAVALTCAGIVVGTGTFAAFVHIPSLFALTSSPYGTALIFKLVFVGMMLAAGAWNWKRGTPSLAKGNARAIRRGVVNELLFALTIVLITAVLIGTSPPSVEH